VWFYKLQDNYWFRLLPDGEDGEVLLSFRSASRLNVNSNAMAKRENMEAILKKFEEPDEVRTFEKGKFEIVRLGGMTIGRATYQPGWTWSVHVGPSVGATRCNVEHVGMVLSGCATAAFETNGLRNFEWFPGVVKLRLCAPKLSKSCNSSSKATHSPSNKR
jgi:hypothetical protein